MTTIQCLSGIGDNLYFRPVLKWLPGEISLITPWPQLYHDFPNVSFMKSSTGLRTQNDNMVKDYRWVPTQMPDYQLNWHVSYNCSLIHAFFQKVYGEQPTWIDMSLTVPKEWIESAKQLIKTDKPICLIRSNTLRSEWLCPARNPKNEYLQLFIDMYKDKYHIVSLANLKPSQEWYEKKLEGVNQEILNISLEQTIGLFKLAEVIITSPSFWMPLGMSLDKKMLVIYGAGEQHWELNDIRIKNTRVLFVEPNPFERCSIRKQDAYKDIDRFVLEDAFREITIP